MAKILFVEDDPMISEIYQKKLTISGFEVDTAVTGSEAVKKIKENVYDLVLLDLVLPEMSGIEVLREVRTKEGYDKNLHIAVFSNLNDQENKTVAMDLGISRFIEKSQYNPSELVEEVQRILQAPNKQKESDSYPEVSAQKTEERDADTKRLGTVLLIEDENIFSDLFGNKLREEGFDVVETKTGSEGVERALQGGIDVVVTDLLMLSMKGDEVIARLRQKEITKNIPIIVLTPSATDEEVVRMKELGVQGVFLKTRTTPSELVQVIQQTVANMEK